MKNTFLIAFLIISFVFFCTQAMAQYSYYPDPYLYSYCYTDPYAYSSASYNPYYMSNPYAYGSYGYGYGAPYYSGYSSGYGYPYSSGYYSGYGAPYGNYQGWGGYNVDPSYYAYMNYYSLLNQVNMRLLYMKMLFGDLHVSGALGNSAYLFL